MAGELFGGAALGAVFQEAANQISKALNFETTFENLKSLVDRCIIHAEETKLLNEELNHSNVEIDILTDELNQGKELVNKYSNVPWQECFLLPLYQGELHAMDEKIARSITLVTSMNTARDVKEILSIVRDLMGKQFNFKRLYDPPVKPDFTVGFDSPLNQLKKWLLGSGVSVFLLTGLAGSGKTTLATLLCRDDKVRGNITLSTSCSVFDICQH